MNIKLIQNILMAIFIVYLFFLMVPPINLGWLDDKNNETINLEGFCIKKSKLISRGMTIKECQNSCIGRKNCRYTNTLKSKHGEEKGPCYISYGIGVQRKVPGCNNMETWENKKYRPKMPVRARNYGASPFGGYYRRCWWTRHRRCYRWWWWRWRCWYGWWHKHCRRYWRRGLRRKLRKGEGDCDRHSDCAGRLKCYQRSSGPVPGVNVSGHPNTHDYCYDPNDKDV
tara:strand:- start:1250 stop:1930 length:681 start_codon:yes stop_codon:yes gene_type:complete